MTSLRKSAIMELEKLPEDKLSFIIQIMQGVNGLYTDTDTERKEAFARLEREPFFEDAKEVILSCVDGKIKGRFFRF